MKVGDKVMWNSQAGGIVREKTGTIVFIVPAYKSSWGIVRKALGNTGPWLWSPQFDTVMRNHESYLVSVEMSGKAKAKLYWPRVNALKVVE